MRISDAERALRWCPWLHHENEASSEVIKAIQCVPAGEIHASQRVTARLLQRMSQKRTPARSPAWTPLADRELEVFQMLGRGKAPGEIAQALNLGESTVETYRAVSGEAAASQRGRALTLRAQWVRDHGA